MLEPSSHRERAGDRLLISSEVRADGAELRLSGELTIATTDEFDEQLRATELSSPAVLVIDLRDIRFLDSVALRALIAADKRARETGRRLRLVMTAGPIQRLFTVTQLDARFDIRQTAPGGSGP